ncbi:hemolysin family protein [Arcobacter sp. FWKO B]|uniref:hemolysin family protein n=1 Tax=Arcobacter sp. FWKO B TaxID=2593672 RepID=UPI0018A6606D|nr:hemolysin family protein [Arcobacter sp. FWKO B]QOG11748.1 HlyC/CorC family transporter [Arcobacter sp. FWKO B]
MEIFLLLLFLILLSGLFSGSEIALVSLSDAKVKALVDQKAKNSLTIQKLKKNPNRMLITILIGNNLVNISASVVATIWTTQTFGNQYLGYATGILTLFVLIFGEIFPKVIAQKFAVIFSQFVANILIFLQYLFYPVVLVLEYILHQTTKRLQVSDDGLTKITEAKAMIEIVKESGDIEENIEKIINNTFDFDTKCVSTIMTPKNQIVSINSNATVNQLKNMFIQTSRSRILVYEGNQDNIIGVISTKMFISSLDLNLEYVKDFKMESPIIIPQDYHVDDLLITFQELRQHIAVIKDSDNILGVVTMENILEEIVGEIFDETQKDRKFVYNLSNSCFMVRYDTTIDEIRKYLHNFEEDEQRFKSIENLFLEKTNNSFEINKKYFFDNYIITPVKIEYGRVIKFKICNIDK